MRSAQRFHDPCGTRRLRSNRPELKLQAREITGHVLSRFHSTETALIGKVLTFAADQAECWFTAGIQKAMSEYNGPVNGATTEGKEK